MNYEFSDNLTFNSNIGLDYETGRRDYFVPSTVNSGRVFISSFTIKTVNNFTSPLTPALRYVFVQYINLNNLTIY